MTAIKSMTRFERQLFIEKESTIANTRCRICQEPIGKKTYRMFEERYFHAHCLKLATPITNLGKGVH